MSHRYYKKSKPSSTQYDSTVEERTSKLIQAISKNEHDVINKILEKNGFDD